MKCTFLKINYYEQKVSDSRWSLMLSDNYTDSRYDGGYKKSRRDYPQRSREEFQDCIKEKCSAYRTLNGKEFCKKLP